MGKEELIGCILAAPPDQIKAVERALSGGYTPPNGDWVPAADWTVAPIRLPGGARLGGDASPRWQMRFWREQSRSGVDATPSSRSNGVESGEGAASTLRLPARRGRK